MNDFSEGRYHARKRKNDQCTAALVIQLSIELDHAATRGQAEEDAAEGYRYPTLPLAGQGFAKTRLTNQFTGQRGVYCTILHHVVKPAYWRWLKPYATLSE